MEKDPRVILNNFKNLPAGLFPFSDFPSPALQFADQNRDRRVVRTIVVAGKYHQIFF